MKPTSLYQKVTDRLNRDLEEFCAHSAGGASSQCCVVTYSASAFVHLPAYQGKAKAASVKMADELFPGPYQEVQPGGVSRVAKPRSARGVRGHGPPGNFAI